MCWKMWAQDSHVHHGKLREDGFYELLGKFKKLFIHRLKAPLAQISSEKLGVSELTNSQFKFMPLNFKFLKLFGFAIFQYQMRNPFIYKFGKEYYINRSICTIALAGGSSSTEK